FSLYHFVNLMVGYLVGRFGFFGMDPLKGNLPVCDFGCGLILLSFVIMVFVEGDERKAEALAPAIFQVDQNYREMYHRWRQGEAKGAKDPLSPSASELNATAAVRAVLFAHAMEPASALKAVGGFGLVGAGEGQPLAEPLRPASPARLRSGSEPPAVRVHAPDGRGVGAAHAAKLVGVALALVAGSLAGLQSVPATKYNQQHSSAKPTVVVFPQCLGIYICSSFIYLFYAAVARASGWSIPHSA
ncbi:unnamed protein product, partial [Effrenium voratum]